MSIALPPQGLSSLPAGNMPLNASDPGDAFYIVIMDRFRNVVKYLTDAADLTWSNILPGGNDTCTFTIPYQLEVALQYLDYFYRVDVFYAGVKVWAGWIDSFECSITVGEKTTVTCLGYAHALGLRIIPTLVAKNEDAGVLMATIMTSFVGKAALVTPASGTSLHGNSPLADILLGAAVPVSSTSSGNASIAVAGVTVQSFTVTLQTIADTINQLAIMGINQTTNDPFEWIIGPSRMFIYQPPNETPNQFAWIGRDVLEFKLQRGPSSAINNFIYVSGTLGTNSLQTTTEVLNTTSQNAYGQLDGQVTLSNYGLASDLVLAGNTVLAQTAEAQDRVSIKMHRPTPMPGQSLLQSFFVGDVLTTSGFTNQQTFTYRIVSQKFSVTDAGLIMDAELNATKGNLNSLFGTVIAKTAAMGAQQNQQMGTGANITTFPFTLGKAPLASASILTG